MTSRNPPMAYDSTDYPGSPWAQGVVPRGRKGQAIDLSRATWVPRPTTLRSTEAENARRVAIFLASHPGNSHLK